MNKNQRLVSMTLICLMFATLALAATQEQVEADANALHADYLVMAERIEACPEGNCSDVQDMIDDFHALEARLATLHADRATLPGSCPCTTLDATISSIDDLEETLGATIKGIEEQS